MKAEVKHDIIDVNDATSSAIAIDIRAATEATNKTIEDKIKIDCKEWKEECQRLKQKLNFQQESGRKVRE